MKQLINLKKQQQLSNNKKLNKKNNQNSMNKKINVVKRGLPMQQPVDYGKQMLSVMEQGYGKTLSMQPNTLNFAKVYTDPFTTESARIPVFPIVSSSLEKYYATGKGSTNSAGNGWITVGGLAFATSDVGSVVYSNASSTDGIGSGGPSAMSSSPHPLSTYYDNTGSYSVRLVSLGLRVRYLGTTLNASGSVIMAQMAPLGDSCAGTTYTTAKQLPGFKEYTFRDQSWHSITRHIEGQQDTFFAEYDNATSRWVFPDSLAHPWDENFRIFAYIAAGANQPFEWEVSGHYEILGTNLVRRGITTPDTPGFEQVVGTMAERRQRDSTTKDHNVGGTWSTLVGFLKSAAKEAIPLIPKLLTKILI